MKLPAPQPLAGSLDTRRCLGVKRSAPSPRPPPPPLSAAVLPLGASTWNGLDEAIFEDLTHLRGYRLKYNKLNDRWFCKEPVWVDGDDS